MKSKKKLLLLGVGAMGALALGVGATSTFAWYTASQSITFKNASAEGIIANTETEMTLADINLVFVIAPYEYDTGKTAVELTNDSGNVGAVVNGSPITEAADGHKVTNKLAITVKAKEAADRTKLLNTNYKAALDGKQYDATLTAEGNVKFVTGASSAATGAADSATLTITFDGDTLAVNESTLVITAGITLSEHWYAVRTNNPYGVEVTTSSGAKAAEPAEGAAAYVSSQGYYYHSGNWVETDVHDLDKVSIAQNALSLHP